MTAAHTGTAASRLPEPPTDREKYSYLGPQKRWLPVGTSIASLCAGVALLLFSIDRPSRYPLIGAVVLSAAVAVISTITSTARRRVSLESHVAKISAWAPDRIPSVDIFLPTAGEDLGVLGNTFDHVAALRYDGAITIHVLDDSARAAVRALGEAHGFTYHARPDQGRMKKAGNLLHGFGNSHHDFIVVFDADFAPRPDLLRELLPYFDDPAVGIVQSPQYFDTAHRMNWLQRGAGSTQEIFYRWVQPSRDALGAPICVGTNAVYRRSALAAAGGFAQIGHSEDVHTGVNLLKAGYRTCYVPVVLAKGLCPDDLFGFLGQQYRWCTGSMSLLVDPSFHRSTLSFKQRLCFFSGFCYYISTAVLVFTVPIPPLLMIWLYPDRVRTANYLLVIPSLVTTYLVIPHVLNARWGLGFLSVRVGYAFAHAFAIFHLLSGRTAGWVPTGAAARVGTGRGQSLPVKITLLMRTWTATVYLLLWTGIGIDTTTGRTAGIRFVPLIALVVVLTAVQLPLFLPLRATTGRFPYPRLLGGHRPSGVTAVEPAASS